MKIANNKSLKTLSCGTPERTLYSSENVSPIIDTLLFSMYN